MSVHVKAKGLRLPGRLRETSLELRSGQMVCLVGPNGSGKTSLLHSIAGIGNSAGEVRIDGIDPRTRGPLERRKLLSYLPATREVQWPLRVEDLVRLGSAEEHADRVSEVLAALGLAEFAKRRVDRLSTGERSRVLIARALVAQPRLLLLDEPVANLDPLWQLRLMEHLLPLRAGAALLLAMHDLDLAARFADRLIMMEGGRVVADGHPAELLHGPLVNSVFGIEKSEGLWRPAG